MTIPEAPAAPCGCATQPGERRAVAVDPEIKHGVLTRLRRIEGQVRGLQKMVEDERYCTDIINQMSSVQEALRGASRELLRNHLKHCASTAIRGNEPEAMEAMYNELLDLMTRSSRG
jgi:DNA-binding FrmR family transcriptional regulator